MSYWQLLPLGKHWGAPLSNPNWGYRGLAESPVLCAGRVRNTNCSTELFCLLLPFKPCSFRVGPPGHCLLACQLASSQIFCTGPLARCSFSWAGEMLLTSDPGFAVIWEPLLLVLLLIINKAAYCYLQKHVHLFLLYYVDFFCTVGLLLIFFVQNFQDAALQHIFHQIPFSSFILNSHYTLYPQGAYIICSADNVATLYHVTFECNYFSETRNLLIFCSKI